MNMKSTAWIVVWVASLAAAPSSAATLVYLLGGQSNMDGYGIESQLPSEFSSPQSDVKLWNSGEWADLQGGYGSPYAGFSAFGPEVSFGHKLHAMFPKDNIYLVKHAVGGSALADAANQWTPNGNGVVYNAFKTTVDAALKNLGEAGLSPSIAGMIWMQGESDASYSSYASLSETNLTNLIAKVRSDFGTPEMPFVLGRIMSYSQYPFGAPPDNALVRSAQVTVPTQVASVSWVDTDNLAVNVQGVAWAGHYNTQGQIGLGALFADKFTVIPEPGTLLLVATGILVTLGYAWRMRMSSKHAAV